MNNKLKRAVIAVACAGMLLRHCPFSRLVRLTSRAKFWVFRTTIEQARQQAQENIKKSRRK